MLSIDLNCDLGEGCGNDAELMTLITSANIACGHHAGDLDTMRRTVELAVENNVAIGAHPGYKDKENFGRVAMDLPTADVNKLVVEQLNSLQLICETLGARMQHFKPHGALYNQAAKDPELASAIAEAVNTFDRGLILYGLSGSSMIEEAERIGLKTASEVFADRTYQSDGTLTPRSQQNALIIEAETSLTQVLDMVRYGRVRSVDAIMVPIKAATVCIHGDGENAVVFARLIRDGLLSENIEVRPPFSKIS